MRWGCLNILSIYISLVTRSTSEASTIFYFSSILIATFSPVRTWVPSFTLPNVPSPNVLPLKRVKIKINYQKHNGLWIFLVYQMDSYFNLYNNVIIFLIDCTTWSRWLRVCKHICPHCSLKYNNKYYNFEYSIIHSKSRCLNMSWYKLCWRKSSMSIYWCMLGFI